MHEYSVGGPIQKFPRIKRFPGEDAVSDQVKLDWKIIRQKAGPYPQEAFQFVREGLQHTVKVIHGGDGVKTPDRHVNGRQLCIGLRDFAVSRYGMLARLVLSRCGITRTDPFPRT